MAESDRVRALTVLAALVAGAFVNTLSAQNPTPPPSSSQSLQNETPAAFKPVTDSFDYVRREEMIPMRDGVKLHTVILVPRGARNAPILFTRTPYDANVLTGHAQSAHLGPILNGYDNAVDV